MIAIPFLFAPLALVVTPPGGGAMPEPVRQVAAPQSVAPLGLERSAAPAWDRLGEIDLPNGAQVRIQQRVVVRVAPRRTDVAETIENEIPPRRPVRYGLQPLGSCLALGDVAGVQVSRQPNRLLLFMRDRRIVAATLERACRARSYYSGFYVEKQDDGQLCVGRDTLRSRSGSSCEVAALHRLVAMRN